MMPYQLNEKVLEKLLIPGAIIVGIGDEKQLYPFGNLGAVDYLDVAREGFYVMRWHSKIFDRSGLRLEYFKKKNGHTVTSVSYVETEKLFSDDEFKLTYKDVENIIEGS